MVKISKMAIAQAQELGLQYVTDDLLLMLQRFANEAAIVTHPHGNRRYGGYVLAVDHGVLHEIHQFEPGTVCNDCHGVKFHQIVDRGRMFNVPCQSCLRQ